MRYWPTDPQGDMTPILTASIEVAAAMLRNPSGKDVPVEPVVAGLTKADRCDRCGAQAHYRVSKDGATLDFCAHDFREHYPKMVDQGWLIVFANPSAWVEGQMEGAP